ncbi:iron-sulfur cluster assembly 2 homolog, mitochondrial [Toxorhynchites rutilus septentrionalis]|uniref:iron-sulfur cluster assembly 2 homolog, mitochondrial n=1 Tax=Toxorhynchites rutilus septentrionalis TaxID=329112 RepID=UPI0024791382|nr:iron-sulfur cluster assembly 2 homolog, mitochondrial [Toxorhynchites rutilus septentrionalis]
MLPVTFYKTLAARNCSCFRNAFYFRKQFSSAVENKRLNLSDTCIKQLKKICDGRNFIRVTVEGGGCSGFQYKFDLDDKLEANDLVFGENHAKVVIDQESIEYVNGSTVDFHTELIRSGFRIIDNPKAEQGCSCGASFSIKIN